MKKIFQLLIAAMMMGAVPMMSSCDKALDNPDNPIPPVPEEIHVKSVTVTADGVVNGEVKVRVGATLQLSAVIAPVDTKELLVVWTSSDENVLTVSDEGLVTAVKTGTATVRVSSAYNPSIFTILTVNVVDDIIGLDNSDPIDQSLAQSRKKK